MLFYSNNRDSPLVGLYHSRVHQGYIKEVET